MKDMIALLVFICMTIITMYLTATKQIEWKASVVFLIFALLASFVIVKYEDIKKFKWGNIEVETAKKEINLVKEEVISQIRQEVGEQKQSIQLLISNANQTSEKIEQQKEAVSRLIVIAQKLQERIDRQAQDLQSLKNFADDTRRAIERLNAASNQTALLIVKATYLAMETKSEFGTPRAQKAIQEVEMSLNQLLPLAIPDTQDRAKWVQELKDTLPSR